MKDVPVIWNYSFQSLLGGAQVEENGDVTIRLTDPEIVSYIKKEKLDNIRAITLTPTPAIPKVEETTNDDD